LHICSRRDAEGQPRYAGIHGVSRLKHEWECWAVFAERAPHTPPFALLAGWRSAPLHGGGAANRAAARPLVPLAARDVRLATACRFAPTARPRCPIHYSSGSQRHAGANTGRCLHGTQRTRRRSPLNLGKWSLRLCWRIRFVQGKGGVKMRICHGR